MFSFALVSKNSTPSCSASCFPLSKLITLSSSMSHLFPTKITCALSHEYVLICVTLEKNSFCKISFFWKIVVGVCASPPIFSIQLSKFTGAEDSYVVAQCPLRENYSKYTFLRYILYYCCLLPETLNLRQPHRKSSH